MVQNCLISHKLWRPDSLSTCAAETALRDMFIVDALIGNWDRHNGNWGFLCNTTTDELHLLLYMTRQQPPTG